jgi:hypothetical protein
MENKSEHRAVSIPGARSMEALPARVPTSRALGFPRARGSGATPVPRSTRLAAALALLAAALVGCESFVQGNGVYQEERRPDPGPFTGVHVESGIEASVTAGVTDRSVTVSGDANVVPYIEVQVQNDAGLQVLHVFISKPFVGTIPPRAVIEVPSLEYALATESSRVSGRSLAATSFHVVGDDGGNVVLEGAALPAGQSLDVRLGNGATLNATAYGVSDGAVVQLSGGSVAKIHSDGPVSGTVRGGSLLDNLHGTGGCAQVVVDGSSTLSCQ